MTTLRSMHVQRARRYNRAAINFQISDWPTQAQQMRELRDEEMRHARNAKRVN